MKNLSRRARLKMALERLEPMIEGLLFLVSATAVVLVVLNEFLPSRSTVVPLLNVQWGTMLKTMQIVTWSAFVLDVFLYGFVSARPIKYAREHKVELIICITWLPFGGEVLLQHLHSLLSLQTLVVIGICAHIWRVARWVSRRYRAHPLVVIASMSVVLISTSAVLLTLVEPETFTTVQSAAFYVYMAIFTVGSDMHAHTTAGRVVTVVVSTFGIGLGWLYLTIFARMMSKRYFDDADGTGQLLEQMSEQSRLTQQLATQLAESTELAARSLALLEAKMSVCTCGHGTVACSQEAPASAQPEATPPAAGESEQR
jgi:hypothetical protein